MTEEEKMEQNRKKGRPKTFKERTQYVLSIEEEEKRELVRLCKKEGYTPAEIIRALIRQWIVVKQKAEAKEKGGKEQ